jgi:acyl carrier protein
MSTPTLTAADARTAVATAIRRIIPDADLDDLGDEATFRAELELDSLDFLSFVEVLSEATGVRIDEDDYPRLSTMASSVDFLTSRSGAGAV